MASFAGGIITSFFETVMPALVAKRKPRSLNVSSTSATACGPCCSTRPSITLFMSRFFSGWFTNAYASGS